MKILYGLQMIQNLNNFLKEQNSKTHATQSGTKIHALLKNIVIDAKSDNVGDIKIIEQIQQHPELLPYFTKSAKTEVPIAGFVNNFFISRRIDRLLIDSDTKNISFIDYKTDTDKQVFVDKYKKQLNEYAQLLRSAYPEYKINGYILWTQDWQFEKIICL